MQRIDHNERNETFFYHQLFFLFKLILQPLLLVRPEPRERLQQEQLNLQRQQHQRVKDKT